MVSRNSTTLKLIQYLSWAITFVFLVFLAAALFRAVINGEPLPLWAWLGIVVILAVGVGLAVLYMVYRNMGKAEGVLAYSPSTKVTGQLRRDNKQVEAAGAESLRAEIKMTEGVLQLHGGAVGVLDAGFAYDDADWQQPAVEYSVDGSGMGDLLVKQRGTGRPAMRQGLNEWQIRLNEQLPTDLRLQFGAGEAHLNLSTLNLTGLHIESGLGELNVDLSGDRRQSLQAHIKLGIGDTRLRLPQHIGVRVQSAVSLGSTHPQSLTWDGGAYTNALYRRGGPALDITVSGGMGKLTIE